MTVPDWLQRHGGSLKPGSNGHTWFVMLSSQPQYTVVERPVGNKYGCFLMHTNSGQPIESSSKAATP
jgi:hypothetical protein